MHYAKQTYYSRIRRDSVCNTLQDPIVTSVIDAKKITAWGESGFPARFLAIEYERVSTPGQDELLSGDTQSTQVKRVATERGFRISKSFRETGSGTSAQKRRQFITMVEYALDPNNRIKAVFFYDPSRFTREISDFYIYLRKLTKGGIEVHSVTLGQYIPGDEVCEITWGFNALFNSIMPRQAARKTRDSQNEATRKGYYISPYTPYGYQKYKITAGEKEHTKLRPHPDQWEHALKMWEMGLEIWPETPILPKPLFSWCRLPM